MIAFAENGGNDGFAGRDIFGRTVGATRGDDGSVILGCRGDDAADDIKTISLTPESARRLAAWVFSDDDELEVPPA